MGHNSRVKRREGYDDWNEGDVCLLLEELAAGTVGHLFGTIHIVEKNLANAIAKSRLMKLMPFRRCERDRGKEEDEGEELELERERDLVSSLVPFIVCFGGERKARCHSSFIFF